MTDTAALIAQMAQRARRAAVQLAAMPTPAKAAALRAAAAAIRADTQAIQAANAEDMAAAKANGLSGALLDRLKLDAGRIEAMAAGVEAVAGLADPVGDVIDRVERPNGLVLTRVRVPSGVIGIIYESRPNVTADAGVLCAMAGNAAILRGGSEAIRSNRAVHAALARGLAEGGMPEDAVQLVPVTDRAAVGADEPFTLENVQTERHPGALYPQHDGKHLMRNGNGVADDPVMASQQQAREPLLEPRPDVGQCTACSLDIKRLHIAQQQEA